jgi:hypothetical protein
MFKPGKNCDGFFDAKELITQVDRAIDIFVCKTNSLAQALFMFNNAPSHQKCATDVILATKMVKSVSYFIFFNLFVLLISQDPKCHWVHHLGGPHMCDGINPLTGTRQSFYFPDNHPHYPGWFKGMEQIIYEHGLWPDAGLTVECTGPKHPSGPATYCYCHLLYTQPDFTSQKPLLQEYIELHGHLCDYYPKYHCKLNFIKQYWGAAKL